MLLVCRFCHREIDFLIACIIPCWKMACWEAGGKIKEKRKCDVRERRKVKKSDSLDWGELIIRKTDGGNRGMRMKFACYGGGFVWKWRNQLCNL